MIRIFVLDTDGGSVSTITDVLNDVRIEPPRGKCWFEPAVAAILSRSRYAGMGHYQPRARDLRDPLPESAAAALTVASESCSGDALVSGDFWIRVRARMKAATHRGSDVSLAAVLSVAYTEHWRVEARSLDRISNHCCCQATYDQRLDGVVDEALERSLVHVSLSRRQYPRRAQQRWAESSSSRARFPRPRESGPALLGPTRDRGRIWQIVSFAAAIDEVRLAVVGQLRDRFDVTDAAAAGFTVDVFLRVALRASFLSATSLIRRFAPPSPRREKGFAGCGAATSVRRMVWRLIARDAWFPPLKYRAGRLLEIICSRCGHSRSERPNRALALRSSLCLVCNSGRPSRKQIVRCPLCARESARWPSAVRKLSNGEATSCKLGRARAGIRGPSARRPGERADQVAI